MALPVNKSQGVPRRPINKAQKPSESYQPVDDSFSSIDDDYDLEDFDGGFGEFDDIPEEKPVQKRTNFSVSDDEEEIPTIELPESDSGNMRPTSELYSEARNQMIENDRKAELEGIPVDDDIDDTDIRVPEKKSKKELKKYYTEDTFIDEKKRKLLPMGSTRKAAKLQNTKVSDYDKRKNRKTQVIVIRTVVLLLMAALVLLGLKNALIPPETMDETDVAIIVSNLTGETGFPLEQGSALAENFIEAYLSVEGGKTNPVLDYYYTGVVPELVSERTGSDAARSFSGNVNQSIVSGPTVYQVLPVSLNSNSYVVGALVEKGAILAENAINSEPAATDPASTDPTTVNTDGATTEPETIVEWKFYQVNMFYDDETETLAITPNSPIVVPPVNLGSNRDIPVPMELGEPNNSIVPEITPTVVGFLREYVKSGSGEATSIDQFIDVNSEFAQQMREGLQGTYTLPETNDFVTMNAYINANGEIKVDANVTWTENIGDNATATTTSNYVVTLEKIGDQYLVTKFAPKVYDPVMEN